jgi:SAM-dependent methyltransferase
MGIEDVLNIKKEDKIILPSEIIPLEDPFDVENEIDMDVARYSERNTTDVSAEDYREMLRASAERGEESVRFWNMLVTTVNKSGYLPPQGRKTEILDIGCGTCEEGDLLAKFFAGQDLGNLVSPDRANFTGIDIDPESIEKAKENHSRFEDGSYPIKLPKIFSFIKADATKLEKYKKVPKEVDVVIIRHQQLAGDSDFDVEEAREIWTIIFKKALERLAENGIILITSYTDIEHEELKDILSKLNCRIVVDEDNKYPIDRGDFILDKKILIVKRI